jgi:hypothetical protein
VTGFGEEKPELWPIFGSYIVTVFDVTVRQFMANVEQKSTTDNAL